MTLDRRHLAAALSLVAGGVVYNTWAFATTQADPSAAAAVLAASPSPDPIVSAGRPDPTHATAPFLLPAEPAADVMIDAPPAWSRDPFMGHRAAPAPSVAPPAEPPPPREPDVVVNSILYSSTRRLAMVNGRTVRVGQRIGGVTVVDILPDAIVVELPSGDVRTIERRSAGDARGRK